MRGWKKSPRRFRFPDLPPLRSNISEQQLARAGARSAAGGFGRRQSAGPRWAIRRSIQPGSMISVQLLSGDFSMGADGTVTYIDGDHIYAFGHRFLDEGPTDIPFARAEVLALLPNLPGSFKISTAREWMGTMTDDRSTAVSADVMGRRAAMAPMEYSRGQECLSHAADSGSRDDAAGDADGVVFGASMRRSAAGTDRPSRCAAHLDFEGGSVRVDNVYSGDVDSAGARRDRARHAAELRDGERFRRFEARRASRSMSRAVDRKSQVQIADIAAPRRCGRARMWS